MMRGFSVGNRISWMTMHDMPRFALLLSVLVAGGCEETGWFCEAGAGANVKEKAPRKCFGKAEFCSGDCGVRETAYCFDAGYPAYVGTTIPAPRYCYATFEGCGQAQEANREATSACRRARM